MRSPKTVSEKGFRVPPKEERTPDVDAVLKAMKNPRAAAKAFIKFEAERSLLNFTRMMWDLVDPGQPLVINWTMEMICEHLEAVSNGQLRRLLINVPPGFSKSTLLGVMWPAWEWGPRNRSDLRMISWSYAGHLTKRDNGKCRDIIESPLFKAMWGANCVLDPRKNTEEYYKTMRKGFRIATSIDGVGTGERGDRLTFDDPHSVLGGDSPAQLQTAINFFGGALGSRVRNADDRVKIIDGMRAEPSTIQVIMQRVAMKDVSGQIISNELGYEHVLVEMEYKGRAHPARKRSQWKSSSIGYVDPREAWVNAIDRAIAELGERSMEMDETDVDEKWWFDFSMAWFLVARDLARLADPIRYPRHAVEEQKRQMILKSGTNAIASQLDQWPFDDAGVAFKRDWFVDKIIPLAALPTNGNTVRGWDLAASIALGADRTATVLMRITTTWVGDYPRHSIYILHARAERLSPGGVEDLIQHYVETDEETWGCEVKPSIPIDPAQAGKSQIHNFTKGILQGTTFDATPEVKDKRKRAAPLASQAEHGNVWLVAGSWVEEFLDELCSFPKGDHDDMVDAASRAYDALVRMLDVGEDNYTPRLVS